MQRLEDKSTRKNFIMILIIAAMFSSFTIWLIESQLKYAFFVFETILISVFYLVLRKNNFKFDTNFLKNIPFRIFSDISLIIFSVTIIFFNVFQIQTFLQLPIAFVSSGLLVGYALLNIFKLGKYFTRLEILILSFFIGFIFSSVLTLALLWIDESSRIILIPIFFLVIGIISILRYNRKNYEKTLQLNSFSNKVDILAIGAAISFYILFFYFMYPEFSLVPSTDV